MKDNWTHRSAGMQCCTCIFFVEKPQLAKGGMTGVAMQAEACNGGPDKGYLGRCRRHAPTINGFPATFGTDWCGDHKLDENKI